MSILTIVTLLIIISAGFSYLNQRFIKLPGTIGVMTISVVVSVAILLIGKFSNQDTGLIVTLAKSLNFSKVLLDIMLGFLLFRNSPAVRLPETERIKGTGNLTRNFWCGSFYSGF